MTLLRKTVQGATQAEGGSVIYWSCFTYTKLGSLVEVIVNVNHYSYIKILDDHVLLFTLHFNNKWSISHLSSRMITAVFTEPK